MVLKSSEAIFELTGTTKESEVIFQGVYVKTFLPRIIKGIGTQRFSEILNSNVSDPLSILRDIGYIKQDEESDSL